MITLTNEQISKQYTKTITSVIPAEHIILGKTTKKVTDQQIEEAKILKNIGMESFNSQSVIVKVVGMDDDGEWLYEVVAHGEVAKMCIDMDAEYVNCIVITPKDLEVVEITEEIEEVEEKQEVIEKVIEIKEIAPKKPTAPKIEAKSVPVYKTERAAGIARNKLLKSFTLAEYKTIRGIYIIRTENGYILDIAK